MQVLFYLLLNNFKYSSENQDDFVLGKNFTIDILIIPGIQIDKGPYVTNSITLDENTCKFGLKCLSKFT